ICIRDSSYVVKESYKEKGLPIPKDFGAHNVEDIKQWGIKNNNFLRTTGKENKAQFITQNIKPGNLMILRENNASHIGIVTKVNKDGSFETIEGNVRYNGIDSVVKQNYNANYSDLSGFVRLSV
ncbi:MAG: CHAP domain-containing protein, partial [Candidatus Gastranaerophilales bacterium]|nr:CHAP domain-containing protein [Candidatus Gastranaerophilales bacterium]